MTEKEFKVQRALGTDIGLRDSIIGDCFTNTSYEPGGLKRFEHLNLDKLTKLIEMGFIKLDEAQNDSPTTQQFFKFMKKFPQVEAHGYCIFPHREDCRITLEGLMYQGKLSNQLVKAFEILCKNADSLRIDKDYHILYSWWD